MKLRADRFYLYGCDPSSLCNSLTTHYLTIYLDFFFAFL